MHQSGATGTLESSLISRLVGGLRGLRGTPHGRHLTARGLGVCLQITGLHKCAHGRDARWSNRSHLAQRSVSSQLLCVHGRLLRWTEQHSGLSELRGAFPNGL